MKNLILLLDIDANVIIALGTAILGGGIFFGLTAYRKAKPEMAKITVEIAGQAVVVQKGVIESLQNELLRQGAELKTLEGEHRNQHIELKKLEREHEVCLKENEEFRSTIDELKEEMKQHTERIESIEKKGEI